MGRKRNGFFIECGAADGKTFSNSLFFELSRNWTGLLIEANPKLYSKLTALKRRSYSINAALCLSNKTERLAFHLMRFTSAIARTVSKEHVEFAKKFPGEYSDEIVNVQCFTLYSLLLAINQTTIDYFSLDVEGPELEVLKTFPFDKINIRVIDIEWSNVNNKGKSREKLNNLRDFFARIDYSEVRMLNGQDVVFKKNNQV